MIPFILPNLYHRLHTLPESFLSTDSNYYDWMEDIWKYVEPSYHAFYAWARQRVQGEVTDLGCGDGNVGRAIGAVHFYDYVQSFPEVKYLDLNAKQYPPLLGDTFVMSHLLEHLKNPKEVLDKLFATLKSGDRIIICVPDGGNMESTALPFQQYIPSNDGKTKHKHHIYAWTSADLYNTLVSGGWDGIDIGAANVCGFGCIWAFAIKS